MLRHLDRMTLTYCQNFNKSHSQQCFVVNPFKSGAGERGGPFHCKNKSQATRALSMVSARRREILILESLGNRDSNGGENLA